MSDSPMYPMSELMAFLGRQVTDDEVAAERAAADRGDAIRAVLLLRWRTAARKPDSKTTHARVAAIDECLALLARPHAAREGYRTEWEQS